MTDTSFDAMRNANTGKAYELMVKTVYDTLCNEEIFSDVRHNVLLDGPDGPRQIDVLVVHEHANVRYLTIIECKDYRGKINVTQIDSFASKLLDVKASKGILVCRNGFSKTACQKAKRLGIELCLIDTAEKLLKGLVVEVPVVLSVISRLELKTNVFLGNKTNKEIPINGDQLTIINDRPLRELVIEELRSGQLPIPTKSCNISWLPESIKPPFYIRDANMNPLEIEWFKTDVFIQIDFYVGKADEFPDFITHLQEGDESARVFVPNEFRLGISTGLAHFKDKKDVPLRGSEAVPCLILPPKDRQAPPQWSMIPVIPKLPS
jgi:Restriction endonuclease